MFCRFPSGRHSRRWHLGERQARGRLHAPDERFHAPGRSVREQPHGPGAPKPYGELWPTCWTLTISPYPADRLFLPQARLKLDRRTRSSTRNHKVGELLQHLGLADCAHTLIGEPGSKKVISGGERKRLAFATEVSSRAFRLTRQYCEN